ncbi:MAG: alpha/beta hydrolase [Proteobacteria bacterium]|nr:alpha/beta hydrolase [Pseudomonadota bacterium]
MTAPRNERLTIGVGANHRVSAVLDFPDSARALLVLAHGAGAGMEHPSMQFIADGLTERRIAALRYQFPYMARGSRRPDPPALCHATVRAAAAAAARLAPDLPLFAGGRSFGGRMTSQAQSLLALPGVRGLAFLAFPLHPAGKPGTDRAAHLREIGIPMLFIQGTRDGLAQRALLQPVVDSLGSRARLHLLDNADHAFHVPARSGRKDAEVREEALSALCHWMDELAIGS